ncbi:phospholipase D family protein [Planomicrobium sp. CPCC 101110]|uniref:phospholipase D family protein n=1 Tax=Planomicrobium sp. CPCC 101110 TaxID=2599619 RepID=UPI0011B3A9F1|nr:phospholipase D family protein [Planomicrobium sp. CPCC 101110]TWT27574.1 phospholipase [Planomicrobium sp. CPCC 101110]
MKGQKWQGWGRKKQVQVSLAAVFVLTYIGVMLWHTYKPLPEGISYAGEMHNVETIDMLYDLSYAPDKEGTGATHELQIFDEINQAIDRADDFIVLDFFLFDNYNDQKIDFPKIAGTLTDHLLAKKEENPDFPITFITDPVNGGYGSYESELIDSLKDAGIEVVYTDLTVLRDSVPIYSGLYRILFQWFDFGEKGWIANGMSSEAPEMKLASYAKLMNIKANHRKVVITEKEAIISSANPHDASGFHGNMAFKVSGPVINDMLESEEAVSRLSGGPDLPRTKAKEQEGPYQAQFVTEKKILDALLGDIAGTEKGDTIWLAMFFISETDVVEALTDAAGRGVDVQMILDPNENSFGNKKTGLPNRPAANEMLRESNGHLKVRWYNAFVGQFHTKTIMIQTAEETIISAGAANYTERALNNYNLESNIRIIAPNDSELVKEMDRYFTRLWENEDALYTLDTGEYQNSFSFFQRSIYGFQKIFKLTTY